MILIIGGGISGISAAKVILKGGGEATILESSPATGGLMARIANCRVGFSTFFDEIKDNPRLRVITGRGIDSVKKKDGFLVTLDDGETLEAEKIIISTGLTPYDPARYKGKRVLTSLEYDALIDQRNGELPPDFEKIAFVLCVGSRSEEYPLCSSVCCSYSLREIKWTLQRSAPEIKVFYNDLRFFGQEFYLEKLYRDNGVGFVRANTRYFDEDEDGVTIRYYTDTLHVERFNYVVLAIGLRPNKELVRLSGLFGFTLNEYGFVKEETPLAADAPGLFVSGGALEPMNIKDSILTGFGAAIRALGKEEHSELIYREPEPELVIPEDKDSYLFFIGSGEPSMAFFAEYLSSRFIRIAAALIRKGKKVYVVTKNLVTPSLAELEYEKARRDGVFFIHLEEGEQITFDGESIHISGRNLSLEAQLVVKSDDYEPLFRDREFLSLYRSEPQLRWSPTKWGRKRYHAGFIRHPREKRWEEREVYGALGEMLLDREEERVLPAVNEERCSGCGSCKDACPHSAIEIRIEEKSIAVFGPRTVSRVPVAHVKEDTCVGCGLCASTCPSDVISYPEAS
ncbi:MAG TPA: 4Fe-4S binding protein [Syntrophorhabdaceae bacterium]|jgi:heterodisulfide reductase subunit A